MLENYYVYFILDPRKPGRFQYPWLPFSFLYEPFYIGKGKNDRYKDVLKETRLGSEDHRCKVVRKIQSLGLSPIIQKVYIELSQETALQLESFLIITIGRMDLSFGPLVNKSFGGEGTGGGCLRSEEHKRKISEKMKGRVFSAEHREKINQALNRRRTLGLSCGGGKKWDEERKARFSEYMKTSKRTIPVNERTTKGNPLSEEHKRKISESMKKRHLKT